MADVDVEFFEAVYTRFARPALYNPVSNRDPLVEVIRSLTTALGIPISPYHQPDYGGTLGFFFGHRTNRDVYAVCSRHVVLPEEPVPYTSGIPLHADADGNTNPMDEHQPRKVFVLSPSLFDQYLTSIRNRIQSLEQTLSAGSVDNAQEKLDELKRFYNIVSVEWANIDQRVIGELLNEEHFISARANVLDLGPEIDRPTFARCLPSFTYPEDRLLPLRGIISVDEMRQRSHSVIKSGYGSLTTIGRSNGVVSLNRLYAKGNQAVELEVQEWCLLPCNQSFFAKGGDSGSIVVDEQGRFGGLITGGVVPGTQPPDRPCVSYATPFEWVWDDIQ